MITTTDHFPTSDEMLSVPAGAVPQADFEGDADEPRRRRRWIAWLVPLMLLLAAVAGGVAYIATKDNVRTYPVPHLAGLARQRH